MSCLFLTRQRPAKGKNDIMAIWTNEWFDKGQFASMEESRSPEIQYNEHNVIIGMPDTRMPMMINGMIFFRVKFI